MDISSISFELYLKVRTVLVSLIWNTVVEQSQLVAFIALPVQADFLATSSVSLELPAVYKYCVCDNHSAGTVMGSRGSE